jgi:hypothetical protein
MDTHQYNTPVLSKEPNHTSFNKEANCPIFDSAKTEPKNPTAYVRS